MSSTLEADRKPVYLRVADELERKMTGRSAATTVPSEHELAQSYEVSRLTARAALDVITMSTSGSACVISSYSTTRP